MGKEIDEAGAAMAEAIKEMTALFLENYISDDWNYAVDGAVISCDQMCEGPVVIKYENGFINLETEGGKVKISSENGKHKEGDTIIYEAQLKNKIGRLSAVHAVNQTDNFKNYATVTDCICLRDKIEQGLGEEESIISMGNCKIVKQTDVKDIEDREDEANAYGTCYCLIKPILEWTNPICIESLAGVHDYETAGVGCVIDTVVCNSPEHHSTMMWDTKEGKKEGLTRFSKLLCTRGGVITIMYSGQSIDYGELMQQRIDEKLCSISGQGVKDWEELSTLSATELLARMIFQEAHTYKTGEQNAVLFSFINRCFSSENFGAEETNKTVKGLLLAEKQYQSLIEYSDAYHPLDSGDVEGWMNAQELAAIMMVAMEDNLPANGAEDIGLVPIIEDEYIKEEICKEIESMVDYDGNKIENPIGNLPSFRGKDSTYVPKAGEIFIHTNGDEKAGGNVFRPK